MVEDEGRPGSGDGRGADPLSGQDRPTPEGLLTVAEIAELLRVSRMTIYRLVQTGTLPAVRVGHSIRVPTAAVHAYLGSQTGTPAAPPVASDEAD